MMRSNQMDIFKNNNYLLNPFIVSNSGFQKKSLVCFIKLINEKKILYNINKKIKIKPKKQKQDKNKKSQNLTEAN